MAATFVTKLVAASTFVVPVLLLARGTAMVAAVAWGAVLITVMSWRIARSQGSDARGVILEHLFVGAVGVVATHHAGRWIGGYFGGGAMV